MRPVNEALLPISIQIKAADIDPHFIISSAKERELYKFV